MNITEIIDLFGLVLFSRLNCQAISEKSLNRL